MAMWRGLRSLVLLRTRWRSPGLLGHRIATASGKRGCTIFLVQAIGRKPSGRRVLFIHLGKAGGSSTASFLDAAKIPLDQVHCNAVLPEVALAPSFTHTLVVVRDPAAAAFKPAALASSALEPAAIVDFSSRGCLCGVA